MTWSSPARRCPGATHAFPARRAAGSSRTWGSTNGTFVYEGERLVYSSLAQADAWILGDQQEIRLGPHPDEWRLLFSDPTSTGKSRPIHIDEEHRLVWVRSVPLSLPRDQYAVLLALYRRVPHACVYEELCAALDEDRRARKRSTYSALAASEIDSLHHLIHRLRARLEVDPKHPRLILQVPHVGYRLQNQPAPATLPLLGTGRKETSHDERTA